MNQTWKIVTTVFITTIVVSGGIYYFQKTQPASMQQVEQKSEARSLTDCNKLGSSWTLSSNSGTSLSFCYKTSWGTSDLKETSISPEARKGTIYYISFSKSVYNYPLISYSTLDFQKLGDSDVPLVIDWKALDYSKSETELARLFPNENATVQKINVNGKQILKVNRDFVEPLSQKRVTPLDYFMPNIIINGTAYNFHMIGSPEQEADLEKLLESMEQPSQTVKSSTELMKELIIKNYPNATVENYKIFEEVKNPNSTKSAVLFGLDLEKTKECCSKPTGIFINNQGSLGSKYDILQGALEHMHFKNAKWQNDKTVQYDFVISDEKGERTTQKSIVTD